MAALAAALAACVPVTTGRLVTAENTQTTLTLAVPEAWTARRTVLAANPQAKLTVDGPGQASPFNAILDLVTAAGRLPVGSVPAGKHRVITVEALDGAGKPTGRVLQTVTHLTGGRDHLVLDDATTAAGQIASILLAEDRSLKADALSAVDPVALVAAMAGYARDLQMPHLALLDAAAIAKALRTDGKPPAATAAFARRPGRVLVRPTGWPLGLEADLQLTDPASRPVHVKDARTVLIEPVAPGTWSLTVTPTLPGLAPLVLPVTVAADGTVEVAAAFPTAAAAKALATAWVGGAHGTVGTGASAALIAVGGLDYTPLAGLTPRKRIERYTAAGGWQPGPALPDPVVQAAATESGGKLYWFGGLSETGVLGTGGVYDPAGAGTVTALAPLPTGSEVAMASAGALGTFIVLTGGVRIAVQTPGPDEQAAPVVNEETYLFNVTSGTWDFAAPAPTPRAAMASAVVGDRFYTFGGADYDSIFVNGSTQPGMVPTTHVATYKRTEDKWESRAPMPTARCGAATATVNGKVWVIGGAGPRGVASRAVEVYDPATDAWSLMAPLKVGRCLPTVGLVGPKIVVAGGIEGLPELLSGFYAIDARPVAVVEEITP